MKRIEPGSAASSAGSTTPISKQTATPEDAPTVGHPVSTAPAKVPKKPARASGKAGKGAKKEQVDPFKTRRRFVWVSVVMFLSTSFIMFLRFFFPRTIFEPSTRFRIGYPSDFGFGVDERFKQSNRIWVVREPEKMFVIFAKCTHLGCTPNWIESENKFKCPCHGSGYDIEGINFEGPAPRPMDRAQVELDAEGQIVVDTSILYACPPGDVCGFEDPDSYLVV